MPTKGDTIAPKRNIIAPISADAAPAFSCSSFIAIATVLEKQRPMHERRTIISSSNNRKGMPRASKTSTITLVANMPMLATWVHSSGVLKRMELAAAMPKNKAFTPKVTL